MCDPILVTLLKMQPHYSQSSRENATPSSGTSPVDSYKEVPPPPPPPGHEISLNLITDGTSINLDWVQAHIRVGIYFLS